MTGGLLPTSAFDRSTFDVLNFKIKLSVFFAYKQMPT